MTLDTQQVISEKSLSRQLVALVLTNTNALKPSTTIDTDTKTKYTTLDLSKYIYSGL